jgi:hydroxymethylbilane synthase
MHTIRIATRESPLALWQAEYVSDLLRRAHPHLSVELVPLKTQGDKLLDVPLAKVGGKGLFVKELEQALLDGRADVAAHSMKDVPVELPEGLELPVILARHDPRDAIVSRDGAGLASLPAGATLGTSSLRRKCQLARLRPDLRLVDLRGNIHTRLRRLDAGDFDAIVLARAGLERMGMQTRIAETLDPERMLPAIGQGAIGIERRVADGPVAELIAALHDEDTATCVAAERALNRRLGGGCQVPIAGFAELAGDQIQLRGLVATVDGGVTLEESGSAPRAGARDLGEALAGTLQARGASEILSDVYADG